MLFESVLDLDGIEAERLDEFGLPEPWLNADEVEAILVVNFGVLPVGHFDHIDRMILVLYFREVVKVERTPIPNSG